MGGLSVTFDHREENHRCKRGLLEFGTHHPLTNSWNSVEKYLAGNVGGGCKRKYNMHKTAMQAREREREGLREREKERD